MAILSGGLEFLRELFGYFESLVNTIVAFAGLNPLFEYLHNQVFVLWLCLWIMAFCLLLGLIALAVRTVTTFIYAILDHWRKLHA